MKIEAAILLGGLFIIQLIPSESAPMNDGSQIKKLQEDFAKAIRESDFKKAQSIQSEIDKIVEAVELEKLQDDRAQAIRESDFSKAKELQSKIDNLGKSKTSTNQTSRSEEAKYAKIPSWMSGVSFSTRIVGGNEAPSPIPWQVHVHINRTDKDGDSKIRGCGGTIIDEITIISAAHCYFPLSRTTIQFIEAGITKDGPDPKKPSENGQNIQVKKVIIHPSYVESGTSKFDNDIAVLILDTPLIFNDNVGPARLPDPSLNLDKVAGNSDSQLATVSGWGKVRFSRRGQPKDLMYVSVPLISNEKCIKPHTVYFSSNITSNMICAGGTVFDGEPLGDACSGDSGGPLIIPRSDTDDTAMLVGIVSYGYRCGRSDSPGVYTRVTEYISWIQSIRNDPCQDDYDDIDLASIGAIRSTVLCQNGDDNGIQQTGQTAGTVVELQVKTLCGKKYTGTIDDLIFTFCNSDKCCSTGGIQLTNGNEDADSFVVDCHMPDIFGSSQIGDCKDFEFRSESIITGNVTLSNNNGYRGEWVKVRSSDGSFLQCTIDGWIDGDNNIPNERNVPKYRDFSCSSLKNGVECKIGDGGGSGNSEMKIGTGYTIQECIDTVKQHYPTANGATMNNPCPKKCTCWAEFKMSTWLPRPNDGYKSCLFKDANTNGGGDDGNCKLLKVTGDTLRDTLGIYSLSEEKASKSPDYSVYQMVNATSGSDYLNRYIFFNPGEEGWRIGEKEQLSGKYEGFYYYKSSITKRQFWLDKDKAWTLHPELLESSRFSPDAEVKVECVKT